MAGWRAISDLVWAIDTDLSGDNITLLKTDIGLAGQPQYRTLFHIIGIAIYKGFGVLAIKGVHGLQNGHALGAQPFGYIPQCVAHHNPVLWAHKLAGRVGCSGCGLLHSCGSRFAAVIGQIQQQCVFAHHAPGGPFKLNQKVHVGLSEGLCAAYLDHSVSSGVAGY